MVTKIDWENMHKDSTSIFEEEYSNLIKLTSKYHPVSLITNMTTFYYINLNKFDICPGHFEYFCRLLLTSDNYSAKMEEVPSSVCEDLFNRCVKLIENWSISNHARKVKEVESEADFSKQLMLASLAESYVLDNGEININYLKSQLQSLYRPVNEWMEKNLHFTIDECLDIVATIQQLYENKLKAFKDLLHKNGEEFTARIKQTQISSIEIEAIKNEILIQSYNKSKKTFIFLTIEEVVNSNRNIQKSALESFIGIFSCDIKQNFDSNFKYPTDDNIFRDKPIICFEEKFIVPSIQSLYWAILTNLENQIISDENVSDKYLDNKGDYLEEEVERTFKKILPTAQIFNSLYYVIEEDGENKRCELDHLIIFDSNILLVESKSGRFSKPAQRGAFLSLQKNIEENVVKAFEQADRTRQYILNEEIPTFTNRSGSLVYKMENKKDFINIFLINTTLESFREVTTNLHELKDIGSYKYNEYPWSVNINDLRKISEFIKFPTQFIHYIYRRLKINNREGLESKIKSFNELTLFYNYLTENLYFDDQEEKSLLIIENKGRDIINKYLLGLIEEVPGYEENTEFLALIKGIEYYGENGQLGYTNFIMELLEFSSQARENLINTFNELKVASLQEENKQKVLENFISIPATRFKNELGIQIISCNSNSLDYDNWLARGFDRMYQHKLQNLISIINYTDVNLQIPFNSMLFVTRDAPLEEDPLLTQQ
ncbi:hypothetical protein RKD56_004226 [Priestia megaterium]